MSATRSVIVLGAPTDFGAGRRGVDMGPSALRVANLQGALKELGYAVKDWGNITSPVPESLPPGPNNARHLPEIAACCRELAEKVEAICDSSALPLILGGDHSIAAGTISGVASHFRKQEKKIGVIWFDAHADMNTPETTPSGNVHGMPLAALCGRGTAELVEIAGWSPKINARNVAIVGLRSVDEPERGIIRDLGVHAFTMRDIDERGMRQVMAEAIALTGLGTDGLHLSLDLDGLDPEEAPGVGTPVRGGVSYREAHLAMEMIADSGKLVSLEVVEVNPVMDVANQTALLAVELVASAMGKRIL
jgi:arginase